MQLIQQHVSFMNLSPFCSSNEYEIVLLLFSTMCYSCLMYCVIVVCFCNRNTSTSWWRVILTAVSSVPVPIRSYYRPRKRWKIQHRHINYLVQTLDKCLTGKYMYSIWQSNLSFICTYTTSSLLVMLKTSLLVPPPPTSKHGNKAACTDSKNCLIYFL